MSTTPTPVEDDLDTGRMIASRWRPTTLRTTPSKQDRGLFGHPRGLPWMLNVEMWERFSYYGMRAILLYFITDTVAGGGLGLSANSGQVILASYSAAVYLLAIPGGIFADRIIGPWLSTLYGGLVIMAGHICLSIPTPALAWTGIVLVAVGTGFIKPNLSTIVGGLYDDDDPRRDAGFQLFYMSVNLGSLASPLVTGWLREHYGYHAGFFSAAVGMGVALIAFIYGRHKLSAFAFTVPNPIRPQERRSFVLASLLTVVAAAALVAALSALTGSLLDAISATMLIIGGSAFILGYGFQTWTGGAKLSPWWFLAVVFIIQTVAELFLSPVGLSTTSALAPKNFASQTMSLWLLTTATGQGLAGFIISRTENIANSTYYYGLGVVTVAVAIILFIVAPWTERKMADVGVTSQG